MSSEPRSIHTKRPQNKGGALAEKGFVFQHHVAVSFLLDMLEGSDITHVYVETHDDIVVVRSDANLVTAEFVQVKAEEPDQLWTTALILEQARKKHQPVPGTSILEISLSGDSVTETAKFRLVTAYDVVSALDFLKTPLESSLRDSKSENFKAFVDLATTKLGSCVSPNKNGLDYWAKNTLWDHRGPLKGVEADNKVRLDKILNTMGENLLHDQKASLYESLLYQVQKAAIADYDQEPAQKCFDKAKVNDLVEARIVQMGPAAATGTSKLEQKMKEALLSSDQIESARRTRMAYRNKGISGQYLNLDSWPIAEAEVEARLHALRSQMYVQKTPEGKDFLDLCLQEIGDVKEKFGNDIPISMLYGYMYERANRCFHRFSRPPE